MIKHNKNKTNMSILSAFSKEELEAVIAENPSLRGYLQGYLAEVKLASQIKAVPGVESVTKIPDQDPEKGDLKVIYKGQPITIEVKSVGTNTVKEDVLNDTWQGTVAIKNTDKREIEIDGIGIVSSSSLQKGQFDILAICCYAVNESWDFMFIDNDYIPNHDTIPGLLKTSFVVNPATTPCLTEDIVPLLDSVLAKKQTTTVKI